LTCAFFEIWRSDVPAYPLAANVSSAASRISSRVDVVPGRRPAFPALRGSTGRFFVLGFAFDMAAAYDLND
jgi:hypothetical protein